MISSGCVNTGMQHSPGGIGAPFAFTRPVCSALSMTVRATGGIAFLWERQCGLVVPRLIRTFCAGGIGLPWVRCHSE